MPISIGGVIPTVCSGDPNKIKKEIIFTFLKGSCEDPSRLAHLSGGDFPTGVKAKLPLTTRRSEYVTKFANYHLGICDTEVPTKFDHKKETLLRAEVKVITSDCLMGHAGIKYRVKLDYSEGIGPLNFIANTATFFPVLGPSGIQSDVLATPPALPVDNYGFGSTSLGTCNIKISTIGGGSNPCLAPSLRIEGDLISLGDDIHWLVGTPIHQQTDRSCGFLIGGGTSVTFFWTGVNFEMGPIGLVMSLQAQITGQGFVG